MPIRWRENNRPELWVWLIKLESHGKEFGLRLVYADDPAILLRFVLRVHEAYGLANVQV